MWFYFVKKNVDGDFIIKNDYNNNWEKNSYKKRLFTSDDDDDDDDEKRERCCKKREARWLRLQDNNVEKLLGWLLNAIETTLRVLVSFSASVCDLLTYNNNFVACDDDDEKQRFI